MMDAGYPVQFSVDYPARPLDRLSTAFRVFTVIPIAIVLATVAGSTWQSSDRSGSMVVAAGAGGLLFLGPLLMILFRQKYPRWWFDWNRELLRFTNRVTAYLALMDDRYPSTDEEQSVHLDFPYPDVPRELNRWLPLVKWFLAIPHYVVMLALLVASIVVVLFGFVAVLFTGEYPAGPRNFLVAAYRYNLRVQTYVGLLTDQYPPFALNAAV